MTNKKYIDFCLGLAMFYFITAGVWFTGLLLLGKIAIN
jgi:hypothetical protein